MSWEKWDEEHKKGNEGSGPKLPSVHPLLHPDHLSKSGATHTSVQGPNWTPEQAQAALQRLRELPEAEQGYRRFDPWTSDQPGPSQVAMRDTGLFKGVGTLFGGFKENIPTVEMELDPKDVHYAQIAVTRHGVEEKLSGKWENPEYNAKGLPLVVKKGNEYHLQKGFHRATAQALATGKIRALVTERADTKKPKYVKPRV